jgi:rSAM/selenodomain-associated transferase 1
MKEDNALIVFVKNPETGKVKTRLAASVGEEEALSIYGVLVAHTAGLAQATGVSVHVYYSDFIPDKEAIFSSFSSQKVQHGNDLGDRMANAINDEVVDYEKVVLIGSDCAELTPPILLASFELLDHADVVIGPARDGGYYLIGMKTAYPEIFDNIEWSTEFVLEQTIARALQLGREFALLPELGDVDTLEDWLQLGWKTPETK